MIFGALVVVLIFAALAVLVIPVLKTPPDLDTQRREQQNIEIAREKKALLESQLADGQLSQQEFDAGIADLEASLAIDLERHARISDNKQAGKWAIWVIVVLVPLLSVSLYAKYGDYKVVENPSLADPQRRVAAENNAHPAVNGKAPSLAEMIDRVKAHLRDKPDDARAWFVLGRTLMSIKKYPQALAALQRSYDLKKNEPSIMLALADALAMNNGGKMAGKPEQLVKQALAISPNELTGLWLAGLAAEQGGRYRESFDYFVRLLPMLKDDPQSQQELQGMLVKLKNAHPELPELPEMKQAAAPMAGASTASAGNASVDLNVTLDASLAAKAQPGDSLFIYAKAASGPPMPLAAKRLKVADLPLKITLKDSDAMIPQMRLSRFDKIIVGARISKSGRAVASAGDLYAESAPFSRSAQQGAVQLTINRIKQEQGANAAPQRAPIPASAPASAASVQLSVSLDSRLADKAQPGDLLFVYAKAASGPPMPLAAKRLKASDLPLQITLKDSDAMIPQMRLSKFDRIIVGARISKTGRPVASPGDLYAESAPFDRNAQKGVVELKISKVK